MFDFLGYKINSKAILAPMAGYTFYSYRKFMQQFNVGISYSEMVSDHGLIYENLNTLSYLKTDDNEHPLGIQLFGHDSKTIKEAIDIIKKENVKCDFIDLNLACPVKKVTKNGAGSALLKDLDYLKEFISDIVNYSPYPITCKIRLGFDEDNLNFKQVIKILQSCGVKLIAIHARSAKQMYSGKPRYDLLKNIKSLLNIPLIVSGDIFTLDDAINALKITNADGVMIARGGVGNPHLITQINSYFKDGIRLEDATLEMQKEYCLQLAKLMVLDKGEEQAMKLFRSIGPHFFKGFANSKKIRINIASKITTLEQLEEEVKNFQTK